MSSYYHFHQGHLAPGQIAYSSDIIQIEQNTSDAITNAIKDLTGGQSWIINSNEDAFLLTPDKTRNGRYIDQMNLAEGDDADLVSIRETDYRQPLKLARSSIYSIIVKMQNRSEVDVPVEFELHDEHGDLIPNMKSVLNLPAGTDTPTEFEIIFDLDYWPTAHGLEPEDLEGNDQSLLNINTDETSTEQGKEFEEDDVNNQTAGASMIYLYIKALNKNRQEGFDINGENSDGTKWVDSPNPTFGLVINKNSQYGQLLEEDNGSGFSQSETKKGDIYFKKVYANGPTYKCNYGEAVIGGEKVILADTHVTVAGEITDVGTAGNIFSVVYMDQQGHLQVANSGSFLGDRPAEEPAIEDYHLRIAEITTYFADTRDPLIEQNDDLNINRPRSHHERIRRLEKKQDYTADIAIPPRFKHVLTEEDWIDENPNTDLTAYTYNGLEAQDIDSLKKEDYTVTTDAQGNFIVKVSKSETQTISISLKSEDSGKLSTEKNKTKIITGAQTSKDIEKIGKSDEKRVQTFAAIKNMENDTEKGTLKLTTTDSDIIVASTKKEAKLTEYNPWDDSAENRPAQTKNLKPTTRHYTVVSGKNDPGDTDSEYLAMTLFVDSSIKLKKLHIPIYKFKNCTGVKFIIWERQSKNNKENVVPNLKKKLHTSKTFSLKNAKKKKGFQYMEQGFMIDDFKKGGLELDKGQYVVLCLPIVKSGEGTVYVDTYKPKNSRDFCIRYHGAANASHFSLQDRYQEVWYNPAMAQVEASTYSTKGSIESATISWENKEPIKSIKPIINLTIPKKSKSTATIYVDVGGGWKKVEPDKENKVSGSGRGQSFRWKIVMKSTSKDTPIIKYDKEKKFAISFEITRAEPETSNVTEARNLDKNLCLTSKPIDANQILRNYIGDPNFALDDNKFSNFEFARVWATNDTNEMLIDISACDYNGLKEVKTKNSNGTYSNMLSDKGEKLYYPMYSLYYSDLTLEDFPQISVDYSNYDPKLEYDEHNLRFKLDTDNSYTDNDIRFVKYSDFQLVNNFEEKAVEGQTGLGIDLSKYTPGDTNVVIAKTQFLKPLDLSSYSALKIGMTINGEANSVLSGLGLYISSQNETEAPTLYIDNDEIIGAMEDVLPDLNSSQEQTVETYGNKVVYRKIIHNGTEKIVYYKSIWDSAKEQWYWQPIYNLKSSNIYKIIDRKTKSEEITIKTDEDGNSKKQYIEIEIDPNDINLKFAKEIGIMFLNEGGNVQTTGITSVTFHNFSGMKEDYYKVFDPDLDSFKPANERSPVVCKKTGSLEIPKGVSDTITETNPVTSSIAITHQSVLSTGEYLCYFDLTSKSTSNFNHIGIQLGADSFLSKNMLELHLIQVDEIGNETVIDKLRIPTINNIYYPTTANEFINLSQIFKKIKTTDRFDKIGLYATDKFKTYANKLKNVTEETTTSGTTTTTTISLGNKISLYIGKIALYKAKTIPMMHPIMRMKFYFDEMDEITVEKSGIRKIGTIIEYQ